MLYIGETRFFKGSFFGTFYVSFLASLSYLGAPPGMCPVDWVRIVAESRLQPYPTYEIMVTIVLRIWKSGVRLAYDLRLL